MSLYQIDPSQALLSISSRSGWERDQATMSVYSDREEQSSDYTNKPNHNKKENTVKG